VAAEERPWSRSPFSQGMGNGLGAVIQVDQYYNVVWSNWPVGVTKPSIGPFWSRSFKNFEGSSIWDFHYIPPPGDANSMHAPGNLVDGSNYYFKCDVPVLNNSYPIVDYQWANWHFYSDVGLIYCVYSTNGPPPPPDYVCYFDLEGVAFFDGQTNKSFGAHLYVASAIDNTYPGPFSLKASYFVSESGAFTKSYGPHKLGTVEVKYNDFYYWKITIPGQLDSVFPQAMTDINNPNEFHYVTKFDFSDFNTNTPYEPPIPTNSPPDPYVDYPGPWNTNIYGPCPPYYYPWPPNYPPPPPLDQWPQYPPPNWPYNTNSPYNPPGPDDPTPDPNNPTNYPDPGPGNTNGAGGSYTLAQWYEMFRSALRDEANSYVPSDPAQYGLTYSNDLLRAANDYTAKFFAESDKIQTDSDAFLVKAKGILDVVSLPLPNVGIKESFSFTFPYLNQIVEIKTSDWPIIGVFRTFMKWIMALISFWVAFTMIKRTFGRV